MKFNPYNFKTGDEVVLDKDFHNPSIVIIQEVSPLGLLSTIISIEDEKESKTIWSVMTDRLSPLNYQVYDEL